MATNNRQRRKEKQARIKKKKQQRNILKRKTSSGIKVHILENPFANISEDDRRKIIDEIQKSMKKDYSESLVRLQEILREYNPIVILSFIANYGLTIGVGENSIQEHTRQIHQAHVEICQALILQIGVENFNNKTPTSEILQIVLDLLEKIILSNQLKNQESAILNLSKNEINIRKVREYVIDLSTLNQTNKFII